MIPAESSLIQQMQLINSKTVYFRERRDAGPREKGFGGQSHILSQIKTGFDGTESLFRRGTVFVIDTWEICEIFNVFFHVDGNWYRVWWHHATRLTYYSDESFFRPLSNAITTQ